MLGGFLGRRRDEASEAAAASLKSRLRDIAQLGPDVSLSANEIVCSDPACPGTETIVLVMVPGQRTRALKVQKAMGDVTDGDLLAAWRDLSPSA